MSNQPSNELVGQFEDVQALLEVVDLALRKIAGCETIPLEKTLSIAGGLMDSALTELRELADREVKS
ncbi:MAG: hypothetical protein KDI15_02670 [Thiothrix sp.]|nr:hypothetical protein [Thiothrix sp.]HPE62197.1 hypothetical protein [Thiolinea sp.]